MLNLPIAMFNHLLFSLVFFLAQTADISIASPKSGDILRGQVDIVGNMNVPNFASAELAFSYAIPVGGASNPADSWFTIQTFPQPVTDPTLAVWDTTTVTDGDYVLHLRVLLQDGSTQDVAVSDLKIRNDVPLPTVTPAATATPDSITLNPIPISSTEGTCDYSAAHGASYISLAHIFACQPRIADINFHLFKLRTRRIDHIGFVCLLFLNPPPPKKLNLQPVTFQPST